MAKDVKEKKRVLIVGAGAAGMSCAYHLADHPDKFDVAVIEATDYCGGQAFSIPIDADRHGAAWLNQGVQGGSYIFHHTMTMFSRQGYVANPVKLPVSFGKGDQFWTNVYPTKLLARHQPEIKRFYRMLSLVRWFEVIFALLPIKYLMKLFMFSYEFANTVALPMVALFLGTGNFTPDVPAIILERLCTSPTYGMWYPPDKNSIASNLPPMVVFPNLGSFYSDWHKDLLNKGVKVRLSTELTQVVSRSRKDGVVVKMVQCTPSPDAHNRASAWPPEDEVINTDADAKEETEHYDEIVLCVLADTAKRLPGKTSTFRERQVLGSAKFSDDITITHWDADYMRKHYENFYNPEQAVSTLSGVDQTVRCDLGKNDFRPMYYIKPYPQDMTRLEMCFDCTNYQAQFPPDVPDLDRRVFQTIFLNNQRDGELWTDDEINPDKVLRKTGGISSATRGHTMTRFASSWTMINAHEVAIMSGIAAAVDLGATYPEDLERDSFALLAFRLYYLVIYGRWYRRKADSKKKKGAPGESWGTGPYGAVYTGLGVVSEERQMWRDESVGAVHH